MAPEPNRSRKPAGTVRTIFPGKGRALYGPMPVKTETFRELWAPLVHTNFGGNSYGPIIGPYLFLGKFVWTNGPESSSKASPYTGIGPWMALPSWNRKWPEPLEPFSRNRSRHFLLNCAEKLRKATSPEEALELKSGTTRTVPCTNRNWTEPWPPRNCSKIASVSLHLVSQSRRHPGIGRFWEVLNGVGVDGVGVIFPFFCAFFPFFCAFFPFFCAFFPFFCAFLLKDKGQQQQFTAKNGEFHSDPVCTDPVQNFPTTGLIHTLSPYLLLTCCQGSPETYFRTYFWPTRVSEIFGASRRTRAT